MPFTTPSSLRLTRTPPYGVPPGVRSRLSLCRCRSHAALTRSPFGWGACPWGTLREQYVQLASVLVASSGVGNSGGNGESTGAARTIARWPKAATGALAGLLSVPATARSARSWSTSAASRRPRSSGAQPSSELTSSAGPRCDAQHGPGRETPQDGWIGLRRPVSSCWRNPPVAREPLSPLFRPRGVLFSGCPWA